MMVAMRRTKSKPTKRPAKNQPSQRAAEKLPFIAHIRELRKRVLYVALSVIFFGSLAYMANETLSAVLLKPAGDQQFIYTSPGGGFNFLMKLCLYTGLAASIPVVVYQVLRYVQPLIKQGSMRFITTASLASGGLAFVGILFGYIYGLPAAMHFLLQGFSSDRIQALISIQSYMSFVMIYLLGAALLFQVPLVLLLINRIKPLKPSKLMGFQRWFILIAFILGALFSPSPSIQDQLMLAGPMIVMYQISILLIWRINRRHSRPRKVLELRRKDAEAREARIAKFREAEAAWRQITENSLTPAAAVTSATPAVRNTPVNGPAAQARPRPIVTSTPVTSTPPSVQRPRRYVESFSRRPVRRQFDRPTPQTS
jgi:sec-independent protein translocase protein TatC